MMDLAEQSPYEDLPYPYNLPATEVGYQEFYGEGGPGPATAAAMAARVPPVFNAFAAADGHGLGIEGMGPYEENWADAWDSDEESDEDAEVSLDSYDDSDSDEDEQPVKKLTRRRKHVIQEDDSDLSSLSSEESEESEEDVRPVPVKRGRKPGIKQKEPKMEPVEEIMPEVEVPPPKKIVKAPMKIAGKAPTKGAKAVELAMKGGKVPTKGKDVVKVDEIVLDETSKPKKIKKKKEKAEEQKQEIKKKTMPAISPEAMRIALPENSAPTLAAAIAAAAPPPPVIAPPPPPPVKVEPPPRPIPIPPPVVRTMSITQPPPTPLARRDTEPSLPPATPNSAASPSVNGSERLPPQPYQHLTELIETSGRPGHIIVNVPIPPSGAGPRPPPMPMVGLDGNAFIGPDPLKPTHTFATIIHRALLHLPRGRGTLGEVCNWVAGEWEWFRLNPEAGWQNSIRHNLSLHKAFLKVLRIPQDDPESKGSVWIIDPEEGPLFEEKQRRDAAKSEGKVKNAEVKRERERQKADERVRKLGDKDYVGPDMPKMPIGIQRQMPIPARPTARPPPVPPANQIVSANAKGVLLPKGKITVVIQPITPPMRAKSVISTTDASGALLPFVCDGTTLVLDQPTFHHLTSDIIDKLQQLGAAGAVDVLSAWVVNKNRTLSAKAAAAKAQPPKPPVAAARPPPPRPLSAPKPVLPVRPGVQAQPKPPAKPLPGPAPPGTNLTKVIGMIAEVANARGDVNTVGPNASALLRYIRVVGVDIDLRVAERVWATGVVPPLPPKGAKPPIVNGKPAVRPPAPITSKPVGQPQPQAKPPAPAPNGLKRKLDDPPRPQSSNPAAVPSVMESEAKKAKLEA